MKLNACLGMFKAGDEWVFSQVSLFLEYICVEEGTIGEVVVLVLHIQTGRCGCFLLSSLLWYLCILVFFLNSDFWWLMGERFKRTFFNISQTLWGWLLQAALLSNHHLTRAHSPACDLADQKWIVLAGHPIFDSRRQIPAWPWLWGALPWWRYPLGHRSEWHISTVCVPGLIGGCGRLQVSRERVGERGR